MPRRATPSTSILARIRAWFGLRQDDLALFLGVSQQLVQGIEAGRRGLTYLVTNAMLPLARQLPPVLVQETPLPDTLPSGVPAPEEGELDFRRRVCLHRAGKLRIEAGKLSARAHYARRWAEALPALLPSGGAPDQEPEPDPERTAWRLGWLHRRATGLTPEQVTQWHLLRAQAQGLEAEAAALAVAISAAGKVKESSSLPA